MLILFSLLSRLGICHDENDVSSSVAGKHRAQSIVCRLVIGTEHVPPDGLICVAIESRCNGLFAGMCNVYVEPKWLKMPKNAMETAMEIQYAQV